MTNVAVRSSLTTADGVTVIANGTALVEGTDYELDTLGNTIHFLPGHVPAAGSGVTIQVRNLTVENFTLTQSLYADNDTVDASRLHPCRC